jgi:ubiquinone/menaquinone biosynthesis C-methylase UbiE
MTIDESNRTQAEFWTAAGPLWTKLRDRFDAQAGAHGLAAIDALAPAPGATVLDVGCGAGTSTLQLAERVGANGRVVGLDISPTMIDGAAALAAAKGITNAAFAVADVMVESFEGDADAVYSRFGLMFFSDPAVAFTNLRTALRPDGRLGFVCWQSPQSNLWASLPLTVAGRYVEMPFGSDPTAPGPFSLADPARLQAILDAAGFADVEIAPRSAPAHMGDNMDEAVDFLSKMMPPVVALETNDPSKAAELRDELAAELSDWDGPDGVEAPSAVWIVTTRNPG